ncbi:DinB family protein [Knoellia remsis]|uniref:DinB family protein n=1 Tax=Knoellia remsis TaxID=407159 RepID=A0A2T0UCH2_9MICO|nr:DinB family protein [Knoellia remsis]PRY55641.1 DinB family protein [Knoellia remsis]
MSDASRTAPGAPAPGGIVPDTKDWTWTLERPCPDCAFDAGTVPAADIASRVTAYTTPWTEVLARPDVATRPDPGTWSALEYGCHVRDVCDLFAERVALMLETDGAPFENWDQDATAVEKAYADQSPSEVAAQLPLAAARLSSAYAGLSPEQLGRRGVRSNGSEFTVLTLGQYGLHDLAHHLWDVRA